MSARTSSAMSIFDRSIRSESWPDCGTTGNPESPTGTTSRRESRSHLPPPGRRSSSAAARERSTVLFPRRRSAGRCCSDPAVFRKPCWPRLRFRSQAGRGVSGREPQRLGARSRASLPTTTQATIGVERMLWRRSTLAVEFLHLEDIGRIQTHDVNAPAPESGIRPDPARLNVNRIESTAASRTKAMTATFRGYLAGFKGTVQYVWSRTEDDSSGVFDLPADNYDFAAERGRADFDRRHRLNVAGTYEWANDRMRLATLLTVASGAPFDVTTGSDDNHDLIVGDRPAGVTRNTGIGPGLAQVDLRFTSILRAPRPPSADPESKTRLRRQPRAESRRLQRAEHVERDERRGCGGFSSLWQACRRASARSSSSRCATASDARTDHKRLRDPDIELNLTGDRHLFRRRARHSPRPSGREQRRAYRHLRQRLVAPSTPGST